MSLLVFTGLPQNTLKALGLSDQAIDNHTTFMRGFAKTRTGPESVKQQVPTPEKFPVHGATSRALVRGLPRECPPRFEVRSQSLMHRTLSSVAREPKKLLEGPEVSK